MLLLLALPLLVGTALLFNAAFPVRSRLGNGLAVACLIYGQIVLLSEILSELIAIHPPGYVVGHSLLFSAALILWWRRGKPNLMRPWWFSPQEFWAGIRRNRLLAVFAGLVLLIQVVNLALAWIYPVIAVDDFDYHLPRAYEWLELGTARHFPTDDLRQTEFPPNADLVYTWIMAISGSYRIPGLPQWLAGWVTAMAAAGLARSVGHRRGASLLAGLVVLTGTNTVLQMVTRNDNLLAAATGATFVYFALIFLNKTQGGKRRPPDLWYAGLSFGLCLGTKYTGLFLLPGAGLALLAYAFWQQRTQAWRLILALGMSTIAGFALFGSYNYVLNLLDYGNPITMRQMDEASALGKDGPRPDLYGVRENLIRYTYQVMDWSIFQTQETNLLFQENWRLFANLSGLIQANPESVNEFGFHGMGVRDVGYSTAGFGPVTYGALLLSPLAALLFLWRRTPAAIVSLLLLGIAWGWLVSFAWIAPWSPYRMRYFIMFVPMLLAALIPWLYRGPRLRAAWLLPVISLSLWVATWATVYGFKRDSYIRQTLAGQFSYEDALFIGEEQLAFLRTLLPEGSRVGIAGPNLRVYPVMETVPDLHYRILPAARAMERMEQGEVAAILSDFDLCRSQNVPYLMLEVSQKLACVLFADPGAVMTHPAAAAYYRYQMSGSAADPYLALDPGGALVSADDYLLRIDIPTQILGVTDLYIEVQYASGTIPDIRNLSNCNEHPTDLALRSDGLSLHLAPEQYDPLPILQRCMIFYEYNPGLTLESVKVYPVNSPPPVDSASARFVDGTRLLAADFDTSHSACETVALTTWWRANRPPDGAEVALYLVNNRGIALAEQRAPVSGPMDGQNRIDRRTFEIPCDVLPGTYDLLLRRYDATGEAVPIDTASNLQTLVSLGSIQVEAAD
ncbi:MAG: hypothetical protein K8J31_21485 [Anaerolineae bacterium]|nr:hypothetical protein [Anaerolineae bacterium]